MLNASCRLWLWCMFMNVSRINVVVSSAVAVAAVMEATFIYFLVDRSNFYHIFPCCFCVHFIAANCAFISNHKPLYGPWWQIKIWYENFCKYPIDPLPFHTDCNYLVIDANGFEWEKNQILFVCFSSDLVKMFLITSGFICGLDCIRFGVMISNGLHNENWQLAICKTKIESN